MRLNIPLFFRLLYWALFKSKGTHGRLTRKRIKALFWWFTIIPLHNFITWIGFVIDDIFFRGYRRQKIEAPIFIIGNFRSGSTLLQRLMAKDEAHLTAMKTWEIYIAPSITQRKFWKALGWLDHTLLGDFLAKRLEKIEARAIGNIPMHRVALQEVDEDEGILLHNWTSSFLMFIFPFMEVMHPYLHFDSEMTAREKKRSMEFYYRMVQKHVYYHGGKHYIAKNPAFSSKVDALREYFPDAKFIYLARNPVDMLGSKTSFFAYIWRYFNDPLEPYPFKDMLLDLTRDWYMASLDSLERLPDSEYLVIRYRDLIGKLDATTRKIFDQFGLVITPSFEEKLAIAVKEAAAFKSKHKYSLIDMGYSAEQVYRQYWDVFIRFGFDPKEDPLMAEVSKKFAEID
ncbi:sulfotransferase [bacterium]|nr:sulfotransferase [bacterium]